MMVKDVKDKSKVDELVLTIVEKNEPREFQSKWSGASGRVCDATGKDDNGDTIGVSLWNDDIEKVEVDAKVRITNGWASSYKSKMQVSAGKFGKLEII
jgi:ssDNA-binding replication factor A large subunit